MEVCPPIHTSLLTHREDPVPRGVWEVRDGVPWALALGVTWEITWDLPHSSLWSDSKMYFRVFFFKLIQGLLYPKANLKRGASWLGITLNSWFLCPHLRNGWDYREVPADPIYVVLGTGLRTSHMIGQCATN